MKLSSSHSTKLSVVAALALLLSLGTGFQASWIYGKAIAAQILLQHAWRQSLANKTPHKPWSWADMSTVARIDIPHIKRTLIVLSDASGEAMAFGPGLAAGDVQLPAQSTIAIGGHRDTHLAFLEHLPIGAIINLENTAGDFIRYELLDKTVVDTRTQEMRVAQNQPGLVLITCYPFSARQTGGPLRLVARARMLPS